MKKSLFILLPLCALALTSCHKNSGKLAGLTLPDEFDETQEYNISFWAKNDGNDTQRNIYINAVQSFEEIYPNIHVEMRQFTKYEDIYKEVLLNISTDTTPNVCIAYPDHVATYLEGSDVVADITALMSHPSYGLGGKDIKYDSISMDEIYPKFLEEGKIGDTYYTLPFVRSSEALYINENYVKKLGYDTIPEYVTWDWVWEVSEKALKAKEEELAQNPSADSLLYPMIYKSTDNMFISLCKQYGYDFTSEDGQVLMFNDDVTNMLVGLGEHATNKHFETFARVSYPGNFFNKWEAVMCVDSTAGATWIGYDATTHDTANVSTGEKFNTVVRAIPQVDPEHPQMISQGPSICVFNKENTQEIIASWLFSQYLLTTDIQLSYSATEGYLPVTKVATESERFKSYLKDTSEYSVKIDATKLVLDNVNNTFITPVFNGSSNCRSAGSYLIEGIFNKSYKTAEDMPKLYEKCIKFKDLSALMNAGKYIQVTDSLRLNDSDIDYDSKVVYEYTTPVGDIQKQMIVVYKKDSHISDAMILYQFESSEAAKEHAKEYSSMTQNGSLLIERYTSEELNDFYSSIGATSEMNATRTIKNLKFKVQGRLTISKESIILLVTLAVIWFGIGGYFIKQFLEKRGKR